MLPPKKSLKMVSFIVLSALATIGYILGHWDGQAVGRKSIRDRKLPPDQEPSVFEYKDYSHLKKYARKISALKKSKIQVTQDEVRNKIYDVEVLDKQSDFD